MVGRYTEVGKLVFRDGVAGQRGKGVFNGTFAVLVEHTQHHLVIAGAEVLVAGVQILGLGAQQTWVASLGGDTRCARLRS